MTEVTKINQIYKCNVCGNIVNVLHVGGGELVCCGQAMELMQEKTQEQEGKEKHIPIIEKQEEGEGTIVKVGSTEHPMTQEHYIEWIDLENPEKQKTCRKDLKPGEPPESKFCSKLSESNNLKSRAYCNVHGLWVSE